RPFEHLGHRAPVWLDSAGGFFPDGRQLLWRGQIATRAGWRQWPHHQGEIASVVLCGACLDARCNGPPRRCGVLLLEVRETVHEEGGQQGSHHPGCTTQTHCYFPLTRL